MITALQQIFLMFRINSSLLYPHVANALKLVSKILPIVPVWHSVSLLGT